MRSQLRQFSGILAAAMVLSLAGAATTFAEENAANKPDRKLDEDYEMMKVFVDTFETVERNYVKDVDRRELLEAAIRGMMKRLDTYSGYISPEDITHFNEMVEQEFGGIGIQVDGPPRTKRLTVISPLPGTPAFEAGVQAGDVILEIEGESTEDFTVNDAVKLLKGKPGEAVTLLVKHADTDEPEKIRIVRDIIQVPTVRGEKYRPDGSWDYLVDEANKIGYIRLTHFSRHSAEELKAALASLKKADMKGLILDLRFNPGGLLSQAISVTDLFVESGPIVSTNGRNSEERIWYANEAGTHSGFPMAVLVNRFSASASEIVSACLQDYDRAVVIGERTWGKGSVQNVIELENGSSALKLTTASYHRPSGKNIHKFPGASDDDEWGVIPNKGFEIELDTEEIRDFHRDRTRRDVIRRDDNQAADIEDRQLSKAVEYIRGKLNVPDAAGKDKSHESAEKPDKKAASRHTPDGDPLPAEPQHGLVEPLLLLPTT